jgi:hypothetical protein
MNELHTQKISNLQINQPSLSQNIYTSQLENNLFPDTPYFKGEKTSIEKTKS